MKAGRLRHVVLYQESADTPDGLGQDVKAWATVATYRAEVRGLTGREQLLADQVNATQYTFVTHRFVDPSDPGRPKPAGRYLHAGRALYVASVTDPTGERRELRAMCTEDASPPPES